MATKNIAWMTGNGNITLTYTGQGNGSISVSSTPNEDFDERSQTISIVTTEGRPEKTASILIKQKGKTFPIGTVFDFPYTGKVQQITLPKGVYRLQCWGANGGDVIGEFNVNGSIGGYSTGELTLTETSVLYVFVGGKGEDAYTYSDDNTYLNLAGGWNGGGSAKSLSSWDNNNTFGKSFPRPGGGATDFCTVSSEMSYSNGVTNRSEASLLSRCIVAGGGAGASAWYKEETITTTVEDYTTVVSYNNEKVQTTDTLYFIAPPDVFPSLTVGKTYRLNNISHTQGLYYAALAYRESGVYKEARTTLTINSNITAVYVRIYWKIANVISMPSTVSVDVEEVITSTTTTTETDSGKATSSNQGGGTSGKGLYPGTQTRAGHNGGFGFGESQMVYNYRYASGAGGGGWYGGGSFYSDENTSSVDGCGGGSGFVNTSGNASYRPSGYTGLELKSGSTYAGGDSGAVANPDTSGNGYARIEVIG